MKYKQLTEKQKADILDKMVLHAETIKEDNWIEGKLIDKSIAENVKSHALYFLKIVMGEVRKLN